jgi:hypothetical protein
VQGRIGKSLEKSTMGNEGGAHEKTDKHAARGGVGARVMCLCGVARMG